MASTENLLQLFDLEYKQSVVWISLQVEGVRFTMKHLCAVSLTSKQYYQRLIRGEIAENLNGNKIIYTGEILTPLGIIIMKVTTVNSIC